MVHHFHNYNAEALATQLFPFVPNQVIYIERGGRPLGTALAKRFNVPSQGIDIGYPVSRLAYPFLRTVLFPFKEICYRFTAPRLVSAPVPSVPRGRILLVDDSASSGKTLDLALSWLTSMGVERDAIRVAVSRAGRRSRGYVDAALDY